MKLYALSRKYYNMHAPSVLCLHNVKQILRNTPKLNSSNITHPKDNHSTLNNTYQTYKNRLAKITRSHR